MLRIALASTALILFGTGTARACDFHGEDNNSFLAYLDYRGLSEAEQRDLEQRAITQFHDQQMQVAKAKFLSRFDVAENAGDTATAQVN